MAAMSNDDIEASKAPLIEHLVELRTRLIHSAIALIIAIIVCYVFAEDIYRVLTWPLVHALEARGQKPELQFTALYETFFAYVKLALFGGFFISFPLIAAQIWKFVAPGLYKNEQRAFLPFLFATPILFILGAALVYFLIMPMAIKFFLGFQVLGGNGVAIEFKGKVNEYLGLVMKLMLAFGICFQLPVLLTLMGRVGIVSSADLAKRRKYAVIGIAAVAAVLTPPDPISQIGLGVPIYLLYEISIHLVRAAEIKRDQRLREEGFDDDDDDEEEEDHHDGDPPVKGG